jgi:hypothetical protein
MAPPRREAPLRQNIDYLLAVARGLENSLSTHRNSSAHGARHDRPDRAVSRDSQQAEHITAHQGANHADRQIAPQPEAAAAENLAGQPAGDNADKSETISTD